MAELREARHRCVLHMNKLDELAKWAATLGYVRVPVKGEFEVLRLKPAHGPVLIWWKRLSADHATCAVREAKLVKRWFAFRRAVTFG